MYHNDVISLYERHASTFDNDRGRELFERGWLDRFLAAVPPAGTVLDLGCGMGEPMAAYLIGAGRRVVGVDASPALIALCRERFPVHEWIVGDMRALALDRQFDGVLVWDSLFHLCGNDQRLVFPRLAAHARPGSPLMFTSGSAEGEVIGEYCGEPLFHASLDPAEYEQLLRRHGYTRRAYCADDPECGHHTVWLAVRDEDDATAAPQGTSQMATAPPRGPRSTPG